MLPLTAVGALALCAVVLRWPTPFPPSQTSRADDPLKLIKPAEVVSELGHHKPLRLAITGQFSKPEPGSRLKFFYSSHPHYTGRLTEDAVRRLLAAGRAETLQYRLPPAALGRLRGSLLETDTAIRDLSLLIDEFEQRVKQALRSRADRQILIKTRPRERDQAYPRLLAERAKLSSAEGVIWGEPFEDGERHLIVKWAEWPGLRSMYDDRFHMLAARAKHVRTWLQKEFHRDGMALFHPR